MICPSPKRSHVRSSRGAWVLPAFAVILACTLAATAAGPLQSPEQFLGFKVGADNTLVLG